MADIETPVEVGFAEFISRLMSDVFDSVINSQVDQEQRYAELLNATALPPDRYAALYISSAEVAAEACLRFPPRATDGNQTSAVYDGAPYSAATGDAEENPPVFLQTGLRLGKDMLEQVGDQLSLNARAVAAILQALQLQLAEQQINVARQLLARGIPRVIVDSGRINGKLTFNLTKTTSTPDTTPGPAPGTPAPSPAPAPQPLPRINIPQANLFTAQRARILPNVRFLVKQADDRSPQASQLTTNVYGEVEITFKTVT